MTKPQITKAQAQRTLLANSFLHFVKYFWHVVISEPFVPGYHTYAIIEHLDALAKGDISRLLILCHIRSGKSVLVSVFYPCWVWLRDNKTRFISATYRQDLSERDALRSRQLIQSKEFQALFPLRFSDDQQQKGFYINEHGGYRLSASVQGSQGGWDADQIVCDDPISYTDRKSPTIKEKASDYFFNTLSKRLVLSGKDRIVLSGHRISDDDLYARLIHEQEGQKDWTFLVLPAEGPATRTYFNALGWVDPRTEGELLWKDWYTPEKIQKEKRDFRYEYEAVFQQLPVPIPGENLFRREWFNRYDVIDQKYKLGSTLVPINDCFRFITVDIASSESSTADFTSAQVWDITPHNHMILVDEWHEQAEFPKIIRELQRMQEKHNPEYFGVESVMGQGGMSQMLQAAGLPVVKLYPSVGQIGLAKDKVTRSVRLQVKAESGQVWLPREQWVENWIMELCGFPLAAKKDRVDSASYAAILASKRPTRALTTEDQPQPGAVLNDTHEYPAKGDLMTITNILRQLPEKQRNMVAGLRGSTVLLKCENQKQYSEFEKAYSDKELGIICENIR